MKKRCWKFLIIGVCAVLLTGCCLKHEWKAADCEQPKHCVQCGKTEGDALDHQWEDATCENPQICEECDETKGEALGHTWEGESCTVCGKEKDNISCRDSYGAEDSKVRKTADTVVAVLGDRELTNGELLVYYRNSINTFYSQNAPFLSVLGLDFKQPLSQQSLYDATDMTWEQWFLADAIETWVKYAIYGIMAEQDHYVLPKAAQEELDSLSSQLNLYAEIYGYESVEDYLDAGIAPGTSIENYMRYNTAGYLAGNYIEYFYQNRKPTREQIQVYIQENMDALTALGLTQNMGMAADVRHILIQPQDGTTDAQTGMVFYSDEAWEKALAEAEAILEQWKAGGATEAYFAELVTLYSADGGSLETGGLYENVCDDGTYVPSFTQWAVDPTRQPGDTGIVETEYGYHIMYFVQGHDRFDYEVGNLMMEEWLQQYADQVRQQMPLEVFYRKIQLPEIINVS